jgi:superfamily II DNA/RNA helicase
VVKSLEKHGFNVGGLHGDMDQRARMAMLEAFKAQRIPLLVASDVAARGLDIPDVSHVINYDVPIHADDYVHRIGRTGRAGRTGTALSIVSKPDTKYLDAIVALLKKDIPWDGPSIADFVPAPSDEADERPKRGADRYGRGKDGSKRPDGRRGERGRSEAQTSAPIAVADTPRPPRAEEAPRPARSAKPPERSDTRPPRDPGAAKPFRRPERDDEGPAVKGLGDHMPGFLMRQIRPSAK